MQPMEPQTTGAGPRIARAEFHNQGLSLKPVAAPQTGGRKISSVVSVVNQGFGFEDQHLVAAHSTRQRSQVHILVLQQRVPKACSSDNWTVLG